MISAERIEEFATLFDIHYLPQGLCLYRSLLEHGQPFRLWILCLDDEVEEALRRLNLLHIRLISLAQAETPALRQVKRDRNRAEFCWTLTPFLPEFVLQRMPDAERVTYLDADLFFFQTPQILMEEFEKSDKHVLITEHAFAPEYSRNIRFGRFCVQFITFRNTEPGWRVLRWWQDRCLEWCYAREEDGKFGDQKYLDDWPERFSDEVHVLAQTDKTLAPWNVAYTSRKLGRARPIFYHFHDLRLFQPHWLCLFSGYYIGPDNGWIYEAYVAVFRKVLDDMHRVSARRAPLLLPGGLPLWLRRLNWWFVGRFRFTWV
jgi:hypothetical protein